MAASTPPSPALTSFLRVMGSPPAIGDRTTAPATELKPALPSTLVMNMGVTESAGHVCQRKSLCLVMSPKDRSFAATSTSVAFTGTATCVGSEGPLVIERISRNAASPAPPAIVIPISCARFMQ